LKELVGFLTSVGVQKIFLEVAQDNEAAIALYKSLKFTTVGTRRNYYQRADHTSVDAAVLAYINE
jgi:ribosomal-protein-alanine N-acetyltransferase